MVYALHLYGPRFSFLSTKQRSGFLCRGLSEWGLLGPAVCFRLASRERHGLRQRRMPSVDLSCRPGGYTERRESSMCGYGECLQGGEKPVASRRPPTGLPRESADRGSISFRRGCPNVAWNG